MNEEEEHFGSVMVRVFFLFFLFPSSKVVNNQTNVPHYVRFNHQTGHRNSTPCCSGKNILKALKKLRLYRFECLVNKF